MENKKMWTVIKEVRSSSWEVISGVPHWSVLVLMIFVIYINDMTEEINIDMSYMTDDWKRRGV